MLTFDASDSIDHDGQFSDYLWQFGDGLQANGEVVRHAYTSPGTYPLNLTVFDDTHTICGQAEDQASVRINYPPVPKAGSDKTGFTGGAHDAILFNASESFDSDNETLSYFWDFGDGDTAIGLKVFHYFQEPGLYQVQLTVQDPTGLPCGTQTETINVAIQSFQSGSHSPPHSSLFKTSSS